MDPENKIPADIDRFPTVADRWKGQFNSDLLDENVTKWNPFFLSLLYSF
jgi:hypothetical protein